MDPEVRAVVLEGLKALDDLFYVFTAGGEPLYWTDRVTEVTGYTDEEIAEMSPADFFSPDHRERIAAAVQETLESGSSSVEAAILTKDGERIPYEFTGKRLTDDAGETIGFAGIGRDIASRHRRERTLERQANRFEALSIAFPDLAFIVSEEGRYLDVFAGEHSEEWLYEEPDEFLSQTIHDVFPADVADEHVSIIRSAVETGDPIKHEYAVDLPQGRRWFEARVESLPFQIEGQDAAVWVARDVTARKERERELSAQNERLEEFASVVSHDLRNPLTVAVGRLELLREECDSDHLDPIEHALERMDHIIEDVLWLAREGRDIGSTAPVDLALAIEDAWQMVADVATEAELAIADADAGGLGTIVADADRLSHLLENLFRNAIEHGGEGVTVTVGRLDDGFYVEDDGPGIPPEDRETVFDPGYSTTVEGTGFGLSIVDEVSHAHGWELVVTDGADGGARFEITEVESGPG